MAGLSTSHIFISYSRRDTDAMQRIVSYLRGQGLKAWVDNEKLVPGTPIWEREIEKAIDAAYAIVVVLSPDAKDSVWVLNELTLADEFKKRVFPTIVRGDFRDAIPFRLVTRQFVDLRSNEEHGLEALSAALTRYLDELKHIEEERLANEQEAEQDRQEEAQRLATQKVEEERIVKAMLEAEQLAEEKAKEDDSRRVTLAAMRILETAHQTEEARIHIITEETSEKKRTKEISTNGLIQKALNDSKTKPKFANDQYSLLTTKEKQLSNANTKHPIGWIPVLFITLGWTIGFLFGFGNLEKIVYAVGGGTNGFAFGCSISGAIAGTIGGMVTAFILTYPQLLPNWKQIIWLTSASAIGFLIGGAVYAHNLDKIFYLISRYRFDYYRAPQIISFALGGTIFGMIGGLCNVIALWVVKIISNTKSAVWITIAWAIGLGIGGTVIEYYRIINHDVLYSYTTLGFATGAAIGALAMALFIRVDVIGRKFLNFKSEN